MLIPKTHVLRDSAMCQVSAADLVPGDIISFSAGEKVPADIRILTADKLIIDESDVTGESNPKECNASIQNEKIMIYILSKFLPVTSFCIFYRRS